MATRSRRDNRLLRVEIRAEFHCDSSDRGEKDIDSVLEVVEVPLDGTQGLSQLGGGPVELVRSRDRRCRGRAAHRGTAADRRRDPGILQLAPTAVQAAVLVQRLAHLAETQKSCQAREPIKSQYLSRHTFAVINQYDTSRIRGYTWQLGNLHSHSILSK